MVRVCDGRMSGTAYGTVVLHVAPEAAAGGPLGRVRTGDWIASTSARRLAVDCPTMSCARQPSPAMAAALARPTRGWEQLYVDHVPAPTQARTSTSSSGASGDEVARDSH